MPHEIQTTPQGTYLQIHGIYKETTPYQWVREVIVNSGQAGASRVDITFDKLVYNITGIKKGIIIDDGCGMSPGEMEKFFGYLASSGYSIGGKNSGHINFGIGAKVTLLPWNELGLVIISKKSDRPVHSAIIRKYVADSDPRYIMDDIYPGVAHIVRGRDWGISYELIAEDLEARGHGTAIVLLGNKRADQTFYGDTKRASDEISRTTTNDGKSIDASGAHIRTFIANRFWDAPIKIYTDYRSNDKWGLAKVAGLQVSLMAAAASEEKAKDHNMNNPIVMSNGWKVYYALGHPEKEASLGKSWGVIGKMAQISILYQSDTDKASSELYRHEAWNDFGISMSSVKTRMVLIAEPPHGDEHLGTEGVVPTMSRSHLAYIGPSGKYIKIETAIAMAGKLFRDAYMPESITDALRQAINNSDHKSIVADKINKFRELFFGVRIPASLSTSESGVRLPVHDNNTRTTVNPALKKGDVTPDPEGNKTMPEIPVPNIESRDNFDGLSRIVQGAHGPHEVLLKNHDVYWDGSAQEYKNNLPGTIIVNKSSQAVLTVIENMMKNSLASDIDKEFYVDCAVMAIGTQAACRVAHILSNKKNNKRPQEEVDDMLSPAAMSASIWGMYGVEDMVNGYIRDKRKQEADTMRENDKARRQESMRE